MKVATLESEVSHSEQMNALSKIEEQIEASSFGEPSYIHVSRIFHKTTNASKFIQSILVPDSDEAGENSENITMTEQEEKSLTEISSDLINANKSLLGVI